MRHINSNLGAGDMTINKKPMSFSKSIKSTQVFPEHTNHLDTMFGGKILANIDEIAAIAAMKHAETNCVTASIDSVNFLKPIRAGEIVTYEAYISHVGTSSLEVCVQIKVDNPFTHQSDLAVLSFLTFVAVNEDGEKVEVPKVYPTNQHEEWLFKTADDRIQKRQDQRIKSREMIEFLKSIEEQE